MVRITRNIAIYDIKLTRLELRFRFHNIAKTNKDSLAQTEPVDPARQALPKHTTLRVDKHINVELGPGLHYSMKFRQYLFLA
jgi:hypothetical protein